MVKEDTRGTAIQVDAMILSADHRREIYSIDKQVEK